MQNKANLFILNKFKFSFLTKSQKIDCIYKKYLKPDQKNLFILITKNIRLAFLSIIFLICWS